MAIVARDTLPAHLLQQRGVAGRDGQRRMASQTDLAGSHSEVRFRKLERVLKKAALHRIGMGRKFPGFEYGAMAAAAHFGTANRLQAGTPSGATRQQNKYGEPYHGSPPAV